MTHCDEVVGDNKVNVLDGRFIALLDFKEAHCVEINLEVFNYITGTVVVQGEFTSPVMHGHHHRQQQLVTSY